MKHMLPPLPYDYAALEPHIDARTMTLHHDQHHASYVANLNSALEKFPELHERTALWLLLNLSKLPDKARTAVRNNAGGHVNHSLFWQVMAPAAGAAPAGPLAEAIDRDFGGLEQFKARFDEAGGRQAVRVRVGLAGENAAGWRRAPANALSRAPPESRARLRGQPSQFPVPYAPLPA